MCEYEMNGLIINLKALKQNIWMMETEKKNLN